MVRPDHEHRRGLQDRTPRPGPTQAASGRFAPVSPGPPLACSPPPPPGATRRGLMAAGPVPHRASDSLVTRTYAGLLVAQFLAAFNDQAIHASAMFFAINTQTLNEKFAI